MEWRVNFSDSPPGPWSAISADRCSGIRHLPHGSAVRFPSAAKCPDVFEHSRESIVLCKIKRFLPTPYSPMCTSLTGSSARKVFGLSPHHVGSEAPFAFCGLPNIHSVHHSNSLAEVRGKFFLISKECARPVPNIVDVLFRMGGGQSIWRYDHISLMMHV